MQMTFYQSCQSTILFDAWATTDCAGYLASVVAVILMGMIRQFAVAARRRFRMWSTRGRKPLLSKGSSTGAELTSHGDGCSHSDFSRPSESPAAPSSGRFGTPSLSAKWLAWLSSNPAALAAVDGVLAFICTTMALLNMLITMTFNTGLFFGVCLGEALGVMSFDPPVVVCACQRAFVSSDGGMEVCH